MPEQYSEEAYSQESSDQQFFSDMSTHLRDMEEKQKILKDRIVLIGQNLIKERDQTFNEIIEIKKTLLKLSSETARIQEVLKHVTEQLSNTPRKEELAILQRQLDMMKK